MSHPDAVWAAITRALGSKNANGQFTRRNVEHLARIPNPKSFPPVFQSMRREEPGKAPSIRSELRSVIEAGAKGRGWYRLTEKGVALYERKAVSGKERRDSSSNQMGVAGSLVSLSVVAGVLRSFGGYRFTTFQFIEKFKVIQQKLFKLFVEQYGRGGRGAGTHYSSTSHVAKSLSKYARECVNYPEFPRLRFVGYIDAPYHFGSTDIALWECDGDGSSVRLQPSVADDVLEIANSPTLSSTTRQQLIDSRIGQGDFRKRLLTYWKKCPVTGCTDRRVLTASHIKPWSESTNKERLDTYNGLLLTPNVDRLFDQGLISFSDSGALLISALVSDAVLVQLGISKTLVIPLDARHRSYLKHHREERFTPIKNTAKSAR
jgi:hypothetical protein